MFNLLTSPIGGLNKPAGLTLGGATAAPSLGLGGFPKTTAVPGLGTTGGLTLGGGIVINLVTKLNYSNIENYWVIDSLRGYRYIYSLN